MDKKPRINTRWGDEAGLSLLEFGMVIVIIGLLVAGVTTIKEVLSAGRLRSITIEANNYKDAITNFKDFYNAYPGDMTRAWTNWGTDCAATIGACNGDGDGYIEWDDEGPMAWVHLRLSSIVENDLSGTCGGGGSCQALIGVNTPESDYPAGGFYLETGTWGMFLGFGGQQSTGVNNAPLLLAKEAADIDQKLDDNSPVSGWVRSASNSDNCYNTGTSQYVVQSTTPNVCEIKFKLRN